MIHQHKWRILEKDATGYFEKQPGQMNSRIVVQGTFYECQKCDKMILKPTDVNLQMVEVKYDSQIRIPAVGKRCRMGI